MRSERSPNFETIALIFDPVSLEQKDRVSELVERILQQNFLKTIFIVIVYFYLSMENDSNNHVQSLYHQK